MDYLFLQSALQTSPAVRLLRSGSAAMIVSFLFATFKRDHVLTLPRATLLERLRDHLDDLRETEPDAYPRYAMELFAKLHLQLLVVSPLDKTHVVEPFIRACHFVTNTAEEDDSRVYNLSIEEYQEQKRRYRHPPLAALS